MAHRDIVAAYWFGSYRSKSRHRETSGLGWLGQYLKSRVARRLLEHSALFSYGGALVLRPSPPLGHRRG